MQLSPMWLSFFNNFVQTAVSAVGCGDICGIETAKRAFFCGKVRERGFFSFVVLWYTDKKPKGGACRDRNHTGKNDCHGQ